MDEMHWILLSKYLTGECSVHELDLLKDWLIDQENQKLLNEMMLVYQSSMLNDIGVHDSFKNLTRRLEEEKLL